MKIKYILIWLFIFWEDVIGIFGLVKSSNMPLANKKPLATQKPARQPQVPTAKEDISHATEFPT